MSKKLLILLFLFFSAISIHAQFTASGTYYEYTNNLSGTGVDKVYIFNTFNGATLAYSSSAASVSFYSYTNSLSEIDTIPISPSPPSGGKTTYTISNLTDSRAYLVEENGVIKATVWVINYIDHQPILSSIETVESDDKCESLKLYITKSDELYFYGVSGNKRNITRKYTISYNNLVWNESNLLFKEETVTKTNLEIGTEIVISAPLMNTQFRLSGDQFGAQFKIPKEIVSQPYTAIAVEPHIVAEQEESTASNQIANTSDSLGGSAPVNILFRGFSNEPVTAYYTWFIYNKKDLNNYMSRYTDKEITYSFQQSGDFVVKLEVADLNSTCVKTVSVPIKVTESFLDIPPNYFSPDDNEEFRVAYKSLVKFKCTIFNRWGTKLYQWTDPAKGWDGKYNGRIVTTGVYFYVIEAVGSDGVKYKKGGDINILRKR